MTNDAYKTLFQLKEYHLLKVRTPIIFTECPEIHLEVLWKKLVKMTKIQRSATKNALTTV